MTRAHAQHDGHGEPDEYEGRRAGGAAFVRRRVRWRLGWLLEVRFGGVRATLDGGHDVVSELGAVFERGDDAPLEHTHELGVDTLLGRGSIRADRPDDLQLSGADARVLEDVAGVASR